MLSTVQLITKTFAFLSFQVKGLNMAGKLDDRILALADAFRREIQELEAQEKLRDRWTERLRILDPLPWCLCGTAASGSTNTGIQAGNEGTIRIFWLCYR